MAEITMTLDEYEELKRARVRAENETAQLQNELIKAKRGGGDAERFAALEQLTVAALAVVRFGVANLPPETTRRWPTRALRAVADQIHMLPDFGPDERDLQAELRSFADECDTLEAKRVVVSR